MYASREAKGTTAASKLVPPPIATIDHDEVRETSAQKWLIRISPGTAASEPHYRVERARPRRAGRQSAMKQILIQTAGHALFAAALFAIVLPR